MLKTKIVKSTITTINSEGINMKMQIITSKPQNMGEGSKKCRSFRMCLNLNDYSLKQVAIVIDRHTLTP